MTHRQDSGRTGEMLAARYLEREGFQIVARNVRIRSGELDLVARDGAETVFVEVKTRIGDGDLAPDAAVTSVKLERLGRLAELYLRDVGTPDADWRVDVVAIVLERSGRVVSIDHLRGAYL